MGYPEGLSAEKIAVFGRMIVIVDVYDALTAKRCYKNDMTTCQALDTLKEGRGWEYDSELVESFIQCLGICPLGSLVLLRSGNVAFVLKSNTAAPQKPTVRGGYRSK